MSIRYSAIYDPYGLLSKQDIINSEKKLSIVMMELSSSFNRINFEDVKNNMGTPLGGDPFIFKLLSDDPHHAGLDERLMTAASTGYSYIWNPILVNALSFSALRYTMVHEVQHTLRQHQSKRYWKNIAFSLMNKILDFYCNSYAIEDTRRRIDQFSKRDRDYLGKSIQTIFGIKDTSEYFEYIKRAIQNTKPQTVKKMFDSYKDPFARINDAEMRDIFESCATPGSMKRERLYKSMQNMLLDIAKNEWVGFEDDCIPPEYPAPLAMYDAVIETLPVCENCGRMGMFSVPDSVRELAKKYEESITHLPSLEELVSIFVEKVRAHNLDFETHEEKTVEKVAKDLDENTPVLPTSQDDLVQPDISTVIVSRYSPVDNKKLRDCVDEMLLVMEDRFYNAVKQPLFEEWARIPDAVIEAGRKEKKYKAPFVNSLIHFIHYCFGKYCSNETGLFAPGAPGELAQWRNPSIENSEIVSSMVFQINGDFPNVVKHTVNSIKSLLAVKNVTGTMGQAKTIQLADREVTSTEKMTELILGTERRNILGFFHLSYLSRLDCYLDPKWVNYYTIDCPHCYNKIDVFSLNENEYKDGHGCSNKTPSLVPGISEEKIKDKLLQALLYAKRSGFNPEIADSLKNKITKSKTRWQDIASHTRTKIQGTSHTNWSEIRIRPLSNYTIEPKRRSYASNAWVLTDSSGSMDETRDIAYGLSQLTNVVNTQGWVTFCDTEVYWENTHKLKSFSIEEMSQLRVVGRGGTSFLQAFNEYRKYFTKQRVNIDMIYVITDGGFDMSEFDAVIKPPCPVFWLITNTSSFTPPFGKVYNLYNE